MIFLENIERIGDTEFASLLKPLPKPTRYGDVSEFAREDLDERLKRGLVSVDEQSVSALKGVFIKDLAPRLSDWKPRRVSTIVPDGFGGYIEISGREVGDAASLTPAQRAGAIQVWDC